MSGNLTAAEREKYQIPDQFDASDLWLLLGVDYGFLQRDELGFLNFESRELGCTAAMFKAFRAMLRSPKLSFQDVSPENMAIEIISRMKSYHKLLTSNVHRLNSENIPGDFRHKRVQFNQNINERYKGHIPNASVNGIQYLTDREFVRGPTKQAKINLYYNIGYMHDLNGQGVSTGVSDPKGIEFVLKLLIERLAEDILNAKSRSEKIKVIAEFIQDTMLLHPFGDANNRLLVGLILNELLVSIDESPVVLIQPNIFDGQDLDSIVKYLQDGQTLFKDIVNNKTRPTANIKGMLEAESSPHLIHIAAAAGEIALVEKILSFKEDMLYKTNHRGQLPIQVAALNSQDLMLRLLISRMKLPETIMQPITMMCNLPQDKATFVNELCTKINELQPEHKKALTNLACDKANFNLASYMALAIINNNPNIFHDKFKELLQLNFEPKVQLKTLGSEFFETDPSKTIFAQAIASNTNHIKLMINASNYQDLKIVKEIIKPLLDNDCIILYKGYLGYMDKDAISNSTDIVDFLLEQTKDIKTVFDFISRSPLYTKDNHITWLSALITKLKNKNCEICVTDFEKLISKYCHSVYDMQNFVDIFPDQTNALFSLFCNTNLIMKLCNGTSDINQIVETFPEQSDTLFDVFFNSDDEKHLSLRNKIIKDAEQGKEDPIKKIFKNHDVTEIRTRLSKKHKLQH